MTPQPKNRRERRILISLGRRRSRQDFKQSCSGKKNRVKSRYGF